MLPFWQQFLKTLRRQNHGTRARSKRARRQPQTVRLEIEALEDRVVPTVIFNPTFGKETLTAPPSGASNYTVLNSPSVYLIFWGSGWTESQADKLRDDAKAILNSKYLSGLTQYGSDGHAVYGNMWIDPTNPPAGYDPGHATNPKTKAATDNNGVSDSIDTAQEIQKAIDNPNAPIPAPPGAGRGGSVTDSPIYVVITAPAQSNGTNAGYNEMGAYGDSDINMVSIGTSGGTEDYFSDRFSHELAERMTDPESGTGVEVQSYSSTLPTYLNNGNQIGDGEQEEGGTAHYFYRLGGPGGVSVQSFWSANTRDFRGQAGAFIVPDGNFHNIYLDPIWTQGTDPSTRQSGLVFSGTYNLFVTGDQFGANTPDDITVDATDTGVTVTMHTLTPQTRGTPASNTETFYFDVGPNNGKIANITIDARGGANTIGIQEVAADQSVQIWGHSSDTVTIGKNGSVAGILGKVAIDSPGSPQGVTLNVDDGNDGAAQTLFQGFAPRFGRGRYVISWSGLGTVSYAPTTLKALNITGGHALRDDYYLLATAPTCPTRLDTGNGNDNVYVDVTAADSPVTVNLGSGLDTVTVSPYAKDLRKVNGNVTVNGGGTDTLIVDDQNDSASTNVNLTDATLWRTFSGIVSYHGLSSVVFHGGHGTASNAVVTHYHVQNTAAGTTTEIDTAEAASDRVTVDVEASQGPLTVKLGAGNDAVNLSPVANKLDALGKQLTVDGGPGAATLTINDLNGTPGSAPNQAYNYSLAQNSFSRTGTGTVTFNGMSAVYLYAANAGSSGFNVLGVTSTAPGTTYQVYAGTGLNEFLVFDNSYTLNGIQGPLFLHGTSGALPNNDLVFLDDVDKTTAHTFFVTAGATSQSGAVQRVNKLSQRPDMASINYDGLNAYSVLYTAGSAGDTINVQSQAPDLWSIIAAGNGDTVNVGSPSHTMDTIKGDLRIQGLKPNVVLDDSGDSTSRTIDMASDTSYTYLINGFLPQSSVGRGRLWLELDPAAPVTLKTGAGSTATNDVFRVHDLTVAPALTIDGGNGSNTLDFSGYTRPANQPATSWTIDGPDHGTVNGLTFSSVGNLVGSPTNDTFAFRTGGRLSGKLDGGVGSNTLDYSAYQGDIIVDLRLATASAVANGIVNIENVTGSMGNDLLVGDANASIMRGGTGRNLIIGGGGGDQLFGGLGDNLLIAGRTAYDAANVAALQTIMREWTSDDDFNTRVAAVQGGVSSNGQTYALNSSTVFDAGTVADTLDGSTNTGTQQHDWFFFQLDDTLNNKKAGDAYTSI